jgi:hypothetical protein
VGSRAGFNGMDGASVLLGRHGWSIGAVPGVCSQAVMLASRQGPARRLPAQDWDIDVLPPSETAFSSGSHVYRCVAHDLVREPRTSQFRR